MSKSLTFEWKRRYAYHGLEVVFSCKKTLASTFQIVNLTSLPTGSQNIDNQMSLTERKCTLEKTVK